jgi:hypothetical protein
MTSLLNIAIIGPWLAIVASYDAACFCADEHRRRDAALPFPSFSRLRLLFHRA